MGSLKDVMCDPKYKINWKKVFRFCDQMTRGLQCLHNWEPPVYHRDIKSANMLGKIIHLFRFNLFFPKLVIMMLLKFVIWV